MIVKWLFFVLFFVVFYYFMESTSKLCLISFDRLNIFENFFHSDDDLRLKNHSCENGNFLVIIYFFCLIIFHSLILFNEHKIAIQFEFYQKLQVFFVSTADYFEIHFSKAVEKIIIYLESGGLKIPLYQK